MLEFSRLCAAYAGSDEVLHDLSLSVAPGEIVCLLGKNGSGKSTLIKSAVALTRVTGGAILADGEDLAALSTRLRAERVAYLAQNRALPALSAGSLVLHGRFSKQAPPRRYGESDRVAARAAMEKLGILSLWDTPMSALSGGTAQKVYLAMILCQGARYLLLDEPTTYLDLPSRRALFSTLRLLTGEGRGVLLSTHELTDALSVADRIALLDGGRLAFFGTGEKLTESGVLERVFSLRPHAYQTPHGTAYFFDEVRP